MLLVDFFFSSPPRQKNFVIYGIYMNAYFYE